MARRTRRAGADRLGGMGSAPAGSTPPSAPRRKAGRGRMAASGQARAIRSPAARGDRRAATPGDHAKCEGGGGDGRQRQWPASRAGSWRDHCLALWRSRRPVTVRQDSAARGSGRCRGSSRRRRRARAYRCRAASRRYGERGARRLWAKAATATSKPTSWLMPPAAVGSGAIARWRRRAGERDTGARISEGAGGLGAARRRADAESS